MDGVADAFDGDDERLALRDGVDPDEEAEAIVARVLGGRPRPVAWHALDADGAARAWVELDEWVRRLVGRYCLDHRDVPPCWFAHGHLVEELSALRTAHLACFDPAGTPLAPVEWHQVLAATRSRLQLWAGRTGCRAGEHRPDAPPPWASASLPADYASAFAAHVEADLDAR